MAKFQRKNPKETLDTLKQILEYDPISGLLIWKVRRNSKTLIGNIAGSLLPTGYIRIYIDKVQHMAHQLAWLFTYGEWPNPMLDHIDGNRSNNRIENLRISNARINQLNRIEHRNGNLPGTFQTKRLTWVSRININGKKVTLGSFKTEEEANQVYLKKFEEIDPEGFKLYSHQRQFHCN